MILVRMQDGWKEAKKKISTNDVERWQSTGGSLLV